MESHDLNPKSTFFVERYFYCYLKASEEAQLAFEARSASYGVEMPGSIPAGLPVNQNFSILHRLLTERRLPADRLVSNMLRLFEAKQLHQYGLLGFLNGKPKHWMYSSLDNPISELFSQQRFEFRSTDIYDFLRPAMRLATNFVFYPAFAPYWHKLCFGQRRWSNDLPPPHPRNWTVQGEFPWTPYGQIRFEQTVHTWAQTLVYTFSGGDIEGTEASGISFRPQTLDYRIHNFVEIRKDFYNCAKRLASLGSQAEPAQVLRFHFYFAVLLAHQAAHVVEANAFANSVNMFSSVFSRAGAAYGPTAESYMGFPGEPEAGKAFEQSVFGGLITGVSLRLDGVDDLLISIPPSFPGHRHSYRRISMESIARLFRKETWQLSAQEYSPSMFHGPWSR